MTRIEIDGVRPDPEQLWATVSGYGHFTAMQVRGGKVRGIALHLRRLRAANREAFGAGLDEERVRALIRHALGEITDASVRVYVFEAPGEPATMVTARESAEMATPLQRPRHRLRRRDRRGELSRPVRRAPRACGDVRVAALGQHRAPTSVILLWPLVYTGLAIYSRRSRRYLRQGDQA